MKIKIIRHDVKGNKDTVITILLEAYFVLMIINNYLTTPNRIVEWYLGLLLAFVAFIDALTVRNLYVYEVVFYLVLLALHTVSIVYNKNIEITSVVQYFRYIFVAISLPRVKLNSRVTGTVMWICIIFYVAMLVSGHSVDSILKSGVSVNGISAHLILFQALYLFSLEEKSKKDMIIATILCMIIIIWSGSRSGIIAQMFVFLASLQIDGKTLFKRIKKYIHYIPLALVLLLGILLTQNTLLFDILVRKRLSRVQYNQELLIQDVRFQIIGDYFERVFSNVTDFLFGASFADVNSIHLLGDNPHNSYIQLYGMFGFLGFAIVGMLIIRSLIYYRKCNYRLFMVLIAITLRSFGDILAFVGYYDPLFLFLALEYPIINNQKYKVARERSGKSFWQMKRSLSIE